MKLLQQDLLQNRIALPSPAENLNNPENLSLKVLYELRHVSLETWFMKSLKSTPGMKEGTRNEPEILRALDNFLCVEYSNCSITPNLSSSIQCDYETRFRVKYLQTVGLIQNRTHTMIGGSPDAVGCFNSGLHGDFVAAVEVKTTTSINTVVDATSVSAKYGTVLAIDKIGDDQESNALFCDVVSNRDYRYQFLHHAAALDVKKVIYIVSKGELSSEAEILFIACLSFSDRLLQAYYFALEGIHHSAFSWIGGSAKDIPVQYDAFLSDSYASDLDSFCSYYSLRASIYNLIEETGHPIPPTNMIRPKPLVFWNAVKGGVDEYSRAMTRITRTNVSENPLVSVIGRLLASQLNNAAVVYRMFLAKQSFIISDLIDESEHNLSYYDLRKKVTKQQTFNNYSRELAKEWVDEHKQRNKQNTTQEPSDDYLVSRFKRNIATQFNREDAKRLQLSSDPQHEKLKFKSSYCSLCSWSRPKTKLVHLAGVLKRKSGVVYVELQCAHIAGKSGIQKMF